MKIFLCSDGTANSSAKAEKTNELLACSPTPLPRRTLIADITPRTSGELFLYVNDTVLMLPGKTKIFYSNNSGPADLTVMRVSPIHE